VGGRNFHAVNARSVKESVLWENATNTNLTALRKSFLSYSHALSGYVCGGFFFYEFYFHMNLYHVSKVVMKTSKLQQPMLHVKSS
jgi:hypothetical protein